MRFRLMLFMLAILVLTGCTGKDDQKEIELLDEELMEAGNGDVIELTMWMPQGEEDEYQWYLDNIETFNRLYRGKIHVDIDFILRGDVFAYEDQVNTAAVSGGLPDVLAVDGPNIAYYASQDMLIPLDSMLTEDDIEDFAPSLIEQGTYDNHFYAIGISESSVVLFYNKEMLDAAGIVPPTELEEAWTWNEFHEVCKILTTENTYGTTMIYDLGEWMTYCFEQLWLSSGTDIISEYGMTTEGYLNSEEGIKAISVIQDMAQENLFKLNPTPTEFEEEKAATKIGGIWEVANMQKIPNLNWGVTYFPYYQYHTSPSGSWAYGISSDCKERQSAVILLKYLTNTENAASFAKTTNMLPSRKSLLAEWEFPNELTSKVITDQLTITAEPRPRTPIYPLLSNQFSEAVYNIMKGNDIRSELDRAVNIIDSYSQ